MGCFVLRNESIHHIQCGFWNRVVTGNHDYRYLWLEALYFSCNLMTIHLGHVVVNDHGSNRADCRNSSALSGGGGGEHLVSTSFEQCFLVTQHAIIIVDAQNRFGSRIIEHPYNPQTLQNSRRCAPAKAGQNCTLFATVVVQVDAERPNTMRAVIDPSVLRSPRVGAL